VAGQWPGDIHAVDALELQHMAAVGVDHANGFGPVHRAPAPHGDNDVAGLAGVVLRPHHHFLGTGIGTYSRVAGEVERLRFKTLDDRIGPTGFFDARIRYQKNLAGPQVACVASGEGECAGTEHDFRGDEFSQAFHGWAHLGAMTCNGFKREASGRLPLTAFSSYDNAD
jgi:hypothetical protein